MFTNALIPIIVMVAVVVILWRIFQRRYDFSIRRRRGVVQIDGAIAKAKHGMITEFIQKDLFIEGDLVIRGLRSNGRLTLSFRGTFDAGEKQRVRNFLIEVL